MKSLRLGLTLVALLPLACTTETIVRSASPAAVDDDAPAPSAEATKEPSTDEDEPAPSPQTTSKEGIRITLTDVQAALSIGGTTAGPGGELVVLTLRIVNESAPNAISTAYPLFTLSTKDALVKTPELAASEALKAACPQTTTIEVGGRLECAIVFDVKQDGAKELRYRTPSGATLGVAVPPIKRCHSLEQLGTAVPMTSGSPTSPSYTAELPTGTYRLIGGIAYGETGTLLARTLKVGPTTIEQVLTLDDGVVFQMSASYTRDTTTNYGAVTAHMTYTCASPFAPLPATETAEFGYEPATQTLLWFRQPTRDEPEILLRLKKVP